MTDTIGADDHIEWTGAVGNWDMPCVCAFSTWPLSLCVSPLLFDRTLSCLVLNGALFSVLYPYCIHAQCLSVVLGSLEAAQACSVLATRDARSGRGSHYDLPALVCLCTKVTWLILPVVICLSQRLSHACLSMNVIQ
jgi:hypothetical protein